MSTIIEGAPDGLPGQIPFLDGDLVEFRDTDGDLCVGLVEEVVSDAGVWCDRYGYNYASCPLYAFRNREQCRWFRESLVRKAWEVPCLREKVLDRSGHFRDVDAWLSASSTVGHGDAVESGAGNDEAGVPNSPRSLAQGVPFPRGYQDLLRARQEGCGRDHSLHDALEEVFAQHSEETWFVDITPRNPVLKLWAVRKNAALATRLRNIYAGVREKEEGGWSRWKDAANDHDSCETQEPAMAGSSSANFGAWDAKKCEYYRSQHWANDSDYADGGWILSGRVFVEFDVPTETFTSGAEAGTTSSGESTAARRRGDEGIAWQSSPTTKTSVCKQRVDVTGWNHKQLFSKIVQDCCAPDGYGVVDYWCLRGEDVRRLARMPIMHLVGQMMATRFQPATTPMRAEYDGDGATGWHHNWGCGSRDPAHYYRVGEEYFRIPYAEDAWLNFRHFDECVSTGETCGKHVSREAYAGSARWFSEGFYDWESVLRDRHDRIATFLRDLRAFCADGDTTAAEFAAPSCGGSTEEEDLGGDEFDMKRRRRVDEDPSTPRKCRRDTTSGESRLSHDNDPEADSVRVSGVEPWLRSVATARLHEFANMDCGATTFSSFVDFYDFLYDLLLYDTCADAAATQTKHNDWWQSLSWSSLQTLRVNAQPGAVLDPVFAALLYALWDADSPRKQYVLTWLKSIQYAVCVPQPRYDAVRFPKSEFCWVCRRHTSQLETVPCSRTTTIKQDGGGSGARGRAKPNSLRRARAGVRLFPICRECEGARSEAIRTAPYAYGCGHDEPESSGTEDSSRGARVARDWREHGSNGVFALKTQDYNRAGKEKFQKKPEPQSSYLPAGRQDNHNVSDTTSTSATSCSSSQSGVPELPEITPLAQRDRGVSGRQWPKLEVEFAPFLSDSLGEALRMKLHPGVSALFQTDRCSATCPSASQSTGRPNLHEYRYISRAEAGRSSWPGHVAAWMWRGLPSLRFTSSASSDYHSSKDCRPAGPKERGKNQEEQLLQYRRFVDMEEDLNPVTALFCRPDPLPSPLDTLILYGAVYEAHTDLAQAHRDWTVTRAKRQLTLCREALFLLRREVCEPAASSCSGIRHNPEAPEMGKFWATLRAGLSQVKSTEDLMQCFNVWRYDAVTAALTVRTWRCIRRVFSRIQRQIPLLQSQPYWLWLDPTQSWTNEFFYFDSSAWMRWMLRSLLPDACVYKKVTGTAMSRANCTSSDVDVVSFCTVCEQVYDGAWKFHRREDCLDYCFYHQYTYGTTMRPLSIESGRSSGAESTRGGHRDHAVDVETPCRHEDETEKRVARVYGADGRSIGIDYKMLAEVTWGEALQQEGREFDHCSESGRELRDYSRDAAMDFSLRAVYEAHFELVKKGARLCLEQDGVDQQDDAVESSLIPGEDADVFFAGAAAPSSGTRTPVNRKCTDGGFYLDLDFPKSHDAAWKCRARGAGRGADADGNRHSRPEDRNHSCWPSSKNAAEGDGEREYPLPRPPWPLGTAIRRHAEADHDLRHPNQTKTPCFVAPPHEEGRAYWGTNNVNDEQTTFLRVRVRTRQRHLKELKLCTRNNPNNAWALGQVITNVKEVRGAGSSSRELFSAPEHRTGWVYTEDISNQYRGVDLLRRDFAQEEFLLLSGKNNASASSPSSTSSSSAPSSGGHTASSRPVSAGTAPSKRRSRDMETVQRALAPEYAGYDVWESLIIPISSSNFEEERFYLLAVLDEEADSYTSYYKSCGNVDDTAADPTKLVSVTPFYPRREFKRYGRPGHVCAVFVDLDTNGEYRRHTTHESLEQACASQVQLAKKMRGKATPIQVYAEGTLLTALIYVPLCAVGRDNFRDAARTTQMPSQSAAQQSNRGSTGAPEQRAAQRNSPRETVYLSNGVSWKWPAGGSKNESDWSNEESWRSHYDRDLVVNPGNWLRSVYGEVEVRRLENENIEDESDEEDEMYAGARHFETVEEEEWDRAGGRDSASQRRSEIYRAAKEARYPIQMHLHGDVGRVPDVQQLFGIPLGIEPYPCVSWEHPASYLDQVCKENQGGGARSATKHARYKARTYVNATTSNINADIDVEIENKLRTASMVKHSVLVMPFCLDSTFWFRGPPNRCDAEKFNAGTAAVLSKLREIAISEFQGDESRLYLSGVSMGGYGVLELAALWGPDIVAAAVACAPCRELRTNPEQAAYFAKRLARIPMWIFHARSDACCKFVDTLSLVWELLEERKKSGEETDLRFSTTGLTPAAARCFSKHSRTGDVMNMECPYLWMYQFVTCNSDSLQKLDLKQEYPAEALARVFHNLPWSVYPAFHYTEAWRKPPWRGQYW